MRHALAILLLGALAYAGLWWVKHDTDQTRTPHPTPGTETLPTTLAAPTAQQAPPQTVDASTAPRPSAPATLPNPHPIPVEADKQAAVLQTAARFIHGWSTTDPRARAELLEPCTTPQLLEGLASTRPDKITPRTPTGDPIWIRGDYAGVEVQQHFIDSPPIAVLVVPFPDSPSGWAVASVRPLP